MKAYLAIKFREDNANHELIKKVSSALKVAGLTSVVIARDYEKWGEVEFGSSGELMATALREIDAADIVIIEFSEKGVGLGIEAGYAHARGKPIVVVAKQGSEISNTMKGIAERVIFYTDPKELDFRELKKLAASSS